MVSNAFKDEAGNRSNVGAASDGDPNVRHIMRPDVPAVPPDTPIADVARIMAESGLAGIPVVEDGLLIGIITETDIISREAAVDVPPVISFLDAFLVADAGHDFDDEVRRVLAATAGELMTTPVYSVRDSATLTDTATLMIEKRIGTVPVISAEDAIVGIVTRGDLVRIIAKLEQR
jgi:CBS domain-containing protein